MFTYEEDDVMEEYNVIIDWETATNCWEALMAFIKTDTFKNYNTEYQDRVNNAISELESVCFRK
jgi:hypothetical protein